MTVTTNVSEQFHGVGADIADTKAPSGPIERRWDDRKFNAKLVNPANRRKLSVIIVGTGLAVLISGGFLTVPFAVFFFGAGS